MTTGVPVWRHCSVMRALCLTRREFGQKLLLHCRKSVPRTVACIGGERPRLSGETILEGPVQSAVGQSIHRERHRPVKNLRLAKDLRPTGYRVDRQRRNAVLERQHEPMQPRRGELAHAISGRPSIPLGEVQFVEESSKHFCCFKVIAGNLTRPPGVVFVRTLDLVDPSPPPRRNAQRTGRTHTAGGRCIRCPASRPGGRSPDRRQRVR